MAQIENRRRFPESAFRFHPARIVLLATCVFTLVIEFVFDLKREPMWLRLVLLFDWILIGYFFVMSWQRVRHYRGTLLSFIRAKKAEVVFFTLILMFLPLPRISAALITGRIFFNVILALLESKFGARLVSWLNLKPSQSLALSFLGVIGFGTLLLTFPAATVDGQGASLINALFMMTAATCVAGLSVVDIGTTFTLFGQGVILFGMQVGGLGIMVLSASFAVFVGGSIPSRRQVGLREVLDVSTPAGLIKLIKAIALSTATIELFGAICLFFLWIDDIPSLQKRIWASLFHAVSAFCNVGLSVFSNNLINFANDPLVCFVIMFLIITGGIGFFVIADLADSEVWRIKKLSAVWSRLQTQTKVMLVGTVMLNTLGMLLFLFFEFDGALKGLGVGEKILASSFQAVTMRSAGFNTVPLEGLVIPTIIFTVGFMFIGAGPGSTGGGIKITTAGISLMALRAMLRGRQDVELFGRRMDSSLVSRSLSILLIAAIFIGVVLTLLSATQNFKFEQLLFESVSAFGTVGLSLGITPQLDEVGKLLIISLMYVGRIGPLTLALAVGERRALGGVRLPRGSLAVG